MQKVDQSISLSIVQQCILLNICRSSFYNITQQESSLNQELMKLIDKQNMKTSFYGVPRMTNYLRAQDYKVGPKRIRRLYRLMDLHAMGPRQNTSKPLKEKVILSIHIYCEIWKCCIRIMFWVWILRMMCL